MPEIILCSMERAAVTSPTIRASTIRTRFYAIPPCWSIPNSNKRILMAPVADQRVKYGSASATNLPYVLDSPIYSFKELVIGHTLVTNGFWKAGQRTISLGP